MDKTHPVMILIHLQRDNFANLVVKLIRFFTDFNHMLLLQWQVKYIYTLVYLHQGSVNLEFTPLGAAFHHSQYEHSTWDAGRT